MPHASNGDIQLFHETFGDRSAPPLLLVNGLGSQCINYAEEWCERFVAQGFFVIRMDNRDVGLSTHLHHVAPDVAGVRAAVQEGRTPDVPYRLSDMADDAVAVLDHVGVRRAHVMGLSMGGMIVQQLAIDHPDRLRSVTSVMSTTGDPDVGQTHKEVAHVFFAPPPTDRASYVERQIEGIRAWGSPAHVDEERITAQAERAFDRSFDPAGQARQLMAIMASGSRTEALRSVRLPFLVMHGDADRLVDPSGGRRTAATVPGARFVLLEGMGHDYPPEFWDAWVMLVTGHARDADR